MFITQERNAKKRFILQIIHYLLWADIVNSKKLNQKDDEIPPILGPGGECALCLHQRHSHAPSKLDLTASWKRATHLRRLTYLQPTLMVSLYI